MRNRTTFRSSATASVLALWLAMIAPAGAGVGDLDVQFGAGGQVQVAGNAGPHVLELPDGRILVIGRPTLNQSSPTRAREVAINRYLSSGDPDRAYGENGQALVALPVNVPVVSAVALQPDGRVVMAGYYWNNNILPFVARVTPAGALDPGFGSNGFSEPGTGGTEPYYSSTLVMPDGEVLAAVSDWTHDRIDRFGPDGRPLGNLSDAIAPVRLALQGDGRLIVSGYRREPAGSVVMRLESGGRLDRTFGQDGFALLDGNYSGTLSVEPGSDRIVLCGPGVVRLTPDGHPDTTFGLHGTGYVAFGQDAVPAFDFCNRLVTPRQGGIVLMGIRHGQGVDGHDQAFVAGLTSTGTVDTRFGAGTGASELDLGAIGGTGSWWYDSSTAFIATQGGNALLAWLTESDAGLKLARIDLGGLPASSPPTQTPVPVPPATPTPSPTTDGGSGNGGSGQLTLLELAVFALGLGAAALGRRGKRRRTARAGG